MMKNGISVYVSTVYLMVAMQMLLSTCRSHLHIDLMSQFAALQIFRLHWI